MPNRVNRRWLVAKRVDDEITEANFRWAESPVPALEAGQFLVRNLWLSFDPTQIFMIARGDSADPDAGGFPLVM